MDIIRNVGMRETVGATKTTDPRTLINNKTKTASNPQLHRNSLPNLVPKESRPIRPTAEATSTAKLIQPSSVKVYQDVVHHNRNAGVVETGSKKKEVNKAASLCAADVDDDGEECAVSGRLEIRVIQQQQQQKNSPNPEESIYFDAVANANSNITSTENAPNGNDDQTVPKKTVDKNHCEFATKKAPNGTNATAMNSTIDGVPQTDETALHNLRKYFLVTSNDTTTGRLAPFSNDSNCSKSLNIDNNGGAGDDNAPDTTFVSAVTTLPIHSHGIDDDGAGVATSNATCNANNDPLSNNDNNKENPVVSYSSLYPNHSALDQKKLTATALVTTKPPPTPVVALNQSDGTCSSNASTTTTNQLNNRKDINGSTSCSKIPIFNPTNIRMMKCASWAGSDLPLTPAEMNNLTPGK